MGYSFAELSKALDPRKDVKTDKTSIVADAIRVVTQLRAENGQLKQLNKFLEVYAAHIRDPHVRCMLVRYARERPQSGIGITIFTRM